ncbi:MAG TPA: PEGA domain-containing protein [Myxococcales bacterium LLY-WYZ-16_1]|jgi:hypothetical protein|nr:PEGA domain-containing protein [Myxococcales bacterium LLY-WYZ-16_1]
MIGSVLSCLALLGAPGGSEIRVAERPPIALLVHSPTGQSGTVGFSEMIRAVDERMRVYTDLETMPVDGGSFEGCEGRLSCVVRSTRRDYQRDRLRRPDGSYAPYAMHRMRLEDEGTLVPRFMLVITLVSVPGRPDRAVAQLFSTDLALRAFHETRRRPGWLDRVEDRILAEASLARVEQDRLTEDRVFSFLDRLFAKTLRPVFEPRGHWMPFGRVVISEAPAGASIEMDGRTVGVTGTDRTALADVPAGVRTLRVVHPDWEPFEETLRVRTGQTLRVQAATRPRRADASAGPRIVFWSGLLTAAAGTSVLVYAVAADPGTQTICYGTPDCEAGTRFQRASLQGQNPGSVDPGPQGGVLLAPLGYSLIGTGAAWSVGAATWERKKQVPWWSLGIGVAAGALAYGLSAALEGS